LVQRCGFLELENPWSIWISYDLIWISYDFLGSPSSSDFINGGYGLVGKIIENESRWWSIKQGFEDVVMVI
jgi:hypothetical protein